jgi:hypothetical protein
LHLLPEEAAHTLKILESSYLTCISDHASVAAEFSLVVLVLFLQRCNLVLFKKELLSKQLKLVTSDVDFILHISDEQVLIELMNV